MRPRAFRITVPRAPTPPQVLLQTLNDSFRIGSLLGIEVRVHVLFVYMTLMFVVMAGLDPQGSAVGTAAMLGILFSLVLLHELGHCVVAQHFGIRVIDIVLWPLGGMARMSEIPENSKVEGLVAIAGPLVNLTLAAVTLAVLALMSGLGEMEFSLTPQVAGVQSLLILFLEINLMLGILNLAPAFPMDGGRILRAFLARRRPWLQATEIAVRVGRYVAFAMILAPLFGTRLCTLPLIGIFILWAGSRELWATRMRHAGPAFAGGAGGPRAFTLQDLFRMAAEQRARARGGGPPRPVEDEHGERDTQTADPDGGENPETPLSRGGGFSDEDIKRIENIPGRLRRPPKEED